MRVALAAAFLLTACGSQSAVIATGGRTLELVQVSVDAGWATAIEASNREERRYVDSVDPAVVPREEAEAELQRIRDAWDPRFAAFRAVQAAHESAVILFTAFQNDDVELGTFLQALDKVLESYRALRDAIGPEYLPEVL